MVGNKADSSGQVVYGTWERRRNAYPETFAKTFGGESEEWRVKL